MYLKNEKPTGIPVGFSINDYFYSVICLCKNPKRLWQLQL